MNNAKLNYQFVVFPIVLFLVVFVLWASLMSVGEFVRGYGKIVPSGQLKTIQHREGGIVTDILVKAGESVKEKQILYRIKDEFAVSSLGELQINLYGKQASESRLRAEINGNDSINFPQEIMEKYPDIVDNERKLFEQRKKNYQSTIGVLEQQLEQKKSQIQEDRAKSRNINLQYEFAKEQQQILENLVRNGAGSRKELIDSKLKTQGLLSDLEDTQNRMVTNEKGVLEAQSRIKEAEGKFLSDAQLELNVVLLDIEKLKENIAANKDRISRTEVLSPVDGIIKTLHFNTIGGVVSPGGVVADIIPVNDTLIVDARITPQDRARVWLGQNVNIKVTAYDSAIHGQLTGKLVEISADTFIDESNGSPYYTVKVESNVRGFGSGKPLFPGMVAEIDIVSGERTVMEYLLKPILKVFNTALSES